MEDIGCHFKFENFSGNCYHNTDLLLSSGRNCLRYIIRERQITTLFLPYFLCESLTDVSLKEGINIIYYHLDNNMMPIIDQKQLDENSYLYFVNYYGMLHEKIEEVINNYKYVIIDNTHDFFDKKKYSADVIYNYRKYFGVPDGACIISNDLQRNEEYNTGKSINKIMEMVSRDETGDFFHYPSFADADKYFSNEDLCYMSHFTRNYLNAIDYYKILKQRLKNYRYLSSKLSDINMLDISKLELSYMYPFFFGEGTDLRDYLQKKGIYSQMLWPNVLWNGSSKDEINLAQQAVLLPIDQRYSINDMEQIVSAVNGFCKSKILR